MAPRSVGAGRPVPGTEAAARPACPLASGFRLAADDEASASKIPVAAGPRRDLFYFDPSIQDMVPVTGAGHDTANPSFIDDDRRLLFDQDGQIWAWDRVLEVKESFDDINNLPDVSDAVFDASASVMVFHNQAGVFLWFRRSIDPVALGMNPDLLVKPSGAADATSSSATPDQAPSAPASAYSGVNLQGQVVSVAKLAAFGAEHEGIADANIDEQLQLIAFTTVDGLLGVYWVKSGVLDQITEASSVGTGKVEEMALDPKGSPILFGSGGHLYLYFLPTRAIDPMPFANQAFNAVRAHDPIWITEHEYYYHLDLADGRDVFARYNWLSESVRAAFFFNNVFGEGLNLLSTP